MSVMILTRDDISASVEGSIMHSLVLSSDYNQIVKDKLKRVLNT